MQDSYPDSEKAIEMQVLVAITKHNEFIRCGGWESEVKKPEQNSAILVNGCPLAKHLNEGLILNRDVNSTCTTHYNLHIDLPQHLEEFNQIEVS